MDHNGTDFASGFVKIAMEEFYAHNSNNLTGLVMRYWDIVEQELAGESIDENRFIFRIATEISYSNRDSAYVTLSTSVLNQMVLPF